ncbi:MAG: LysE family transporter [Rhizomicrobium sp.]|jgi:threonine/homoserine/homoserine lactone efflux protein
MTWLVLLFSGVFIGLIISIPIGPVNLICIRRTLSFGPLNGFIAGLGSALGDAVFATVIGFGLSAIRQWIEHHSTWIQLAGGLLLLGFGAYTYIADPLHGRKLETNGDVPDARRGSPARTFATTFALAVTNPATLFGFTVLFAGVGGIAATGGMGRFDALFLVLGVVSGSTLWWFTLTTVIGLLHARIDENVMRVINHVSGLLVCLFGLIVLAHVVLHRFT